MFDLTYYKELNKIIQYVCYIADDMQASWKLCEEAKYFRRDIAKRRIIDEYGINQLMETHAEWYQWYIFHTKNRIYHILSRFTPLVY